MASRFKKTTPKKKTTSYKDVDWASIDWAKVAAKWSGPRTDYSFLKTNASKAAGLAMRRQAAAHKKAAAARRVKPPSGPNLWK